MEQLSINPRALSLISELALQPHPEGGYYREVFRSNHRVQPGDGRAQRSALTAIYFLLMEGQHSGWHQVLSDEIWSHLEGDALELLTFEADGEKTYSVTLGEYEEHVASPIHVIPAGVWQAARPRGEYSLLGCYVAPGFDFSDFRMARDFPEISRLIAQQGEAMAACL
jgi:predicted cupin superfamily sugar epimerase